MPRLPIQIDALQRCLAPLDRLLGRCSVDLDRAPRADDRAWPRGLEQAIGRKRVFLNPIFNGITLGGLYFLVASGFTLIFGLMRNVNLAHGSLYLFGGYVGYAISAWTRSWILSFVVAFLAVALAGVLLQICSPSGPVRQIEGFCGGRISGSS